MDEPERRPAPFLRAALAAAFLVCVATVAGVEVAGAAADRRVVLLHGLIRSARSMSAVADTLRDEGYRVCNISYPSRHHPIEVLAAEHVAPQVKRCFPEGGGPIDFVTHSMG
jgi:triacylglycerol esterase/lipase EstA (alpha/beta hydrolase family)